MSHTVKTSLTYSCALCVCVCVCGCVITSIHRCLCLVTMQLGGNMRFDSVKLDPRKKKSETFTNMIFKNFVQFWKKVLQKWISHTNLVDHFLNWLKQFF